MKKQIFFILLAATLCACGNKSAYRSCEGQAWGTFYHITYNSDRDLADSITAVIEEVDLSLSPFRSDSRICRVNSGEDLAADSMFIEVFTLSQRVNTLSHGLFDPTLAPLINLWGFGYREGSPDRPTDEQIDSALSLVGIAECMIDNDGNVVKKAPGTEFNFSAVAKGYGVDRVARMLARNGVTDYMVEIGGEISMAGKNKRGEGWVIQIDAPIDDLAGSHNSLSLFQGSGVGIATSGNYRNFRLTSEGKVGHTISPVTGMPVATDVLSATVIAENCALADALATTAMLTDCIESITLLDSLENVEAIIVHTNPEGGMEITLTSGLEQDEDGILKLKNK